MVCNYPNQSKSISNVPETCAEVTAGGQRGQTKQNKERRKSPAVDKILSRYWKSLLLQMQVRCICLPIQ